MATLSDLKEVKEALDAGLVTQAEFDDVKRDYLRAKKKALEALEAKEEALVDFQKKELLAKEEFLRRELLAKEAFQKRESEARLRTSALDAIVKQGSSIMSEEQKADLVRDYAKMSGLNRGATVKDEPSSKRQRSTAEERGAAPPPQPETPPRTHPAVVPAPADAPTPAAADQVQTKMGLGRRTSPRSPGPEPAAGSRQPQRRTSRGREQTTIEAPSDVASPRQLRRGRSSGGAGLQPGSPTSPTSPPNPKIGRRASRGRQQTASEEPARRGGAGKSSMGKQKEGPRRPDSVRDAAPPPQPETPPSPAPAPAAVPAPADAPTPAAENEALAPAPAAHSPPPALAGTGSSSVVLDKKIFNYRVRDFDEYLKKNPEIITEDWLDAVFAWRENRADSVKRSFRTKAKPLFDEAAGHGYVRILRDHATGEDKKLLDAETCKAAAKGGHLDVLKWLRSQNCHWSEDTCRDAASGGHLDVLKWLRSQDPPCPWNEWTCRTAAKRGHLDVLKWLRSQKPPCPWNLITCAAAALNGHLDVVKWLRSQDPPCPWSEFTCRTAAKRGHLDVVKWLRSQDPPCPWNERTCRDAAWKGHLDVLKWLRSQDPPCPWDEWTCEWAAFNGHLDVLKWLVDNGCPYNVSWGPRSAYEKLGLA